MHKSMHQFFNTIAGQRHSHCVVSWIERCVKRTSALRPACVKTQRATLQRRVQRPRLLFIKRGYEKIHE
jgi:hypothetical protein